MTARLLLRSLFAVAVPAFGPWATVTAQLQVELAPYIGLYLPQDRLTSNQGFTAGGTGGQPPALKQQTSLMPGSRLTLWLRDRVGIQGTLSYAPSSLTNETANFWPPLYPTGAHVVTGSARVVARTSPPGAALAALQVGGGMGFVSHGGPAYNGTSGTTFLSTVINASVAFRLSQSLALRFDADDYLYRAQLQPCGNPEYQSMCQTMMGFTSMGSKAQNDLVLSVGLAVPVGKR